MSRVLLYLSPVLVICFVSVGSLSAQDAARDKDAANQPRKTPEQVFKKMDKNGDGQLDLEEFKRTAKKATTAGEVEKLFQQADKDGDGKVSLEEFAAAKRPKKATEKEAAGKAPEEDLKQIQGMWARTLQVDDSVSGRVTKEVKGDGETVTYYDNQGNVINAHTARIKLHRAGPIRIFAYSDVTYVAGPKQGQKAEGGGAYIYKVVDDTFIEIWGVLGDADERVHALRWKRQKPEEPPISGD